MKILFASYMYLYPPDSGYKKSLYPIIEYMAKKNDTTVLSFYEQNNTTMLGRIHERTEAREINVPRVKMSIWCKIMFPMKYLLNLLLFKPILEDQREMTKVVQDLLEKEKFDVIQIQHLMMTQYFIDCETPKIHAVQDVLSERYKKQISCDITLKDRLLSLFYYLLIVIYEKRVVKYLNHCAMLSLPEKKRLLHVVPKYKNTSIIRYGVKIRRNLDFFKRRPNDLLFVGYIAYRPNFDAVKYLIKNILPHVRVQSRSARLTVVGKGYDGELRRLTKTNGIHVVGHVSDISPYFLSHKIFVSPIRYGGGVRVKILEAMAHGIPVVSTSQGADGISATHKQNIIIADEPHIFAQWVVELLRDDSLRTHIARSAYDFVQKCHDVRSYVVQYEKLYEHLYHQQ